VAGKGFWTSSAAVPDRQSAARQQILSAALAHIDETGLTLGIDDVVIESLLAEAGVKESELDKVWPTRQELLDDVFFAMAEKAREDRTDTQTLLSTWQYLSSRADDLLSAGGRRQVLVDVIRTSAEYNFGAVTATGAWRSYAGLSATILSFPDSPGRQRTLDALGASEMSFVETMEMFYRNVLPTVGYRLKPHFGGDWQPFVVAAASVIEGLGLIRASVPSLVERPLEIAGDGPVEAWSLASLAFMGIVDAFIEPDPDYEPYEAIARLSGGVDVTPSSAEDPQGY
jgi:AcrR family transcriptional regulator